LDETAIYRWIDEHQDYCVKALQRLVRQPSVAATNEGVVECANMLVETMKSLGMEAWAVTAGARPFVYGRIGSKSSDKTLIIYSHYDVERVEPLEGWEEAPYSGIIKGDRMYGRGTTDPKGNLMAHLMAVKAYREVHGDMPVNLKFVFDGEEEISSPTIDRFVAENRTLLTADAAFSLDGGFDASDKPRIQFGNSGLLNLEIQATGSTAGDLHSARARLVESPVWKLVWLLSTMKSADERILIDGFYDNMRKPTPDERKLLENSGWDDHEQMKSLGVTRFLTGTKGPDALQRLLFEPTCNITGMLTGYVGEFRKSILPSSAFVKMDFRLVPDQDPDDVFEKIKAHIAKQPSDGFEVIHLGAVPPSYAPLDSRISKAVLKAARAVYPQGAVVVPRSDGSGKQGPWLGAQIGVAGVASGVGPPGWHGHAPNEFITIGHFLNGIKFAAAVYAIFGRP